MWPPLFATVVAATPESVFNLLTQAQREAMSAAQEQARRGYYDGIDHWKSICDSIAIVKHNIAWHEAPSAYDPRAYVDEDLFGDYDDEFNRIYEQLSAAALREHYDYDDEFYFDDNDESERMHKELAAAALFDDYDEEFIRAYTELSAAPSDQPTPARMTPAEE